MQTTPTTTDETTTDLPDWTNHLFVGDRDDYEIDESLLEHATCISARGMAWPNSDACIGVVFAQANGAQERIAQLFTAAPELLDALDEVMTWIRNWNPRFTDDEEWSETQAKVDGAIAKAKGGAR